MREPNRNELLFVLFHLQAVYLSASTKDFSMNARTSGKLVVAMNVISRAKSICVIVEGTTRYIKVGLVSAVTALSFDAENETRLKLLRCGSSFDQTITRLVCKCIDICPNLISNH